MCHLAAVLRNLTGIQMLGGDGVLSSCTENMTQKEQTQIIARTQKNFDLLGLLDSDQK